MAEIEKRYAELRLKGRRLEGTAVRYGDIATLPWGRERIEPGAFGMVEILDVVLNVQHERSTPLARTGGGGLFLQDGPDALTIRAELPNTQPCNDTLELVRNKILRGLSIEFHATAERNENDLRIIERAELVGMGVVDTGAYPASKVEARRKPTQKPPLGTLKSEIPVDTDLGCECCGANIHGAKLQAEFSDFWQRVMDKVQAKIEAGEIRNVVAASGGYGSPLASLKRGSLRFGAGKSGGLGVELDIPDTAAGAELIEASTTAGVIVRPFIAPELAEYSDDADKGIRTYTKAGPALRGIIVGASDADSGWPDPEIDLAKQPKKRRARIWL